MSRESTAKGKSTKSKAATEEKKRKATTPKPAEEPKKEATAEESAKVTEPEKVEATEPKTEPVKAEPAKTEPKTESSAKAESTSAEPKEAPEEKPKKTGILADGRRLSRVYRARYFVEDEDGTVHHKVCVKMDLWDAKQLDEEYEIIRAWIFPDGSYKLLTEGEIRKYCP